MTSQAAAVAATAAAVRQRPLTSDGAEVVEVLGGEQRGGQLPDELLEQRRGVVGTHLVPADLTRVEVGLQVLLQQLHTEIRVRDAFFLKK